LKIAKRRDLVSLAKQRLLDRCFSLGGQAQLSGLRTFKSKIDKEGVSKCTATTVCMPSPLFLVVQSIIASENKHEWKGVVLEPKKEYANS
jgi:hypothetical protein